MAFSSSVAKKITSIGYCEVCGWEGEELDAHSITGLHLVKEGDGFLVTSAPEKLSFLVGRVLGPGINPLEGHETDGVALCSICHDEIHAIAREQQGSGHFVSPSILSDVTLFMIERGKEPISYPTHESVDVDM